MRIESTHKSQLPLSRRETFLQSVPADLSRGRRKAGAWSHACSCLPRFVVHGLTTGEQYIFRVKAVNAVGTSENSQESDVIKVQAALSE